MPDAHHEHGQHIIPKLVHDPVDADPDAAHTHAINTANRSAT